MWDNFINTFYWQDLEVINLELWIRSQDRERLIKAENLYISKNNKNEEDLEYKISNYYQEIFATIGVYKSKERALEILDEIQDKMRDRYILQGSSVYPTPNVVVYEMPKEWLNVWRNFNNWYT